MINRTVGRKDISKTCLTRVEGPFMGATETKPGKGG